MTSLEIAELTGKQHFHLMRDIRNMEPAWEKVTQSKFGCSTYKDATGRTLLQRCSVAVPKKLFLRHQTSSLNPQSLTTLRQGATVCCSRTSSRSIGNCIITEGTL